jgi:hypothetical protein
MPWKTKLIMTMALTLVLILAFSAAACAETDADPKDVFVKMPTAKDLTKEYDGKQPAWVEFGYDINAEATLWVNDKSKGEDGLGLVWLDIYRWNETTGTYEEYDMGRYPGNMEGPGFNMEKAGFFNYGPRYGARYYSEKTIFPGKYKAVWLIPIYGTNTENYNVYDYVEYEVEFEITEPGIFTAVPELSGNAGGKPVEAPKPAYDLSKIGYNGNTDDVETKIYWYKFDAEKEDYAGGEALESAPGEPGKYVYRLRVTDGKNLDENLYAEFELTDPNKVELFYDARYADIFVLPPNDPSKVYDGRPVTFEDMGLKIDLSRIGRQDTRAEDIWYEYIWYEPNRYGKYTDAIREFQGKETGPTEPGTYRFQWGVHGPDDSFEGHIYILFTISEASPENAP